MVPLRVLIVTTDTKQTRPYGNRDDQLQWILEHGPFDIIIKARKQELHEPVLHKSKFTGKTTLLVGSVTRLGLAALHVRLDSRG